jgi:predicted transcriptional regulator
MKTPKAEEVIPVLRSLIAAELVKTYGLRKAETARLLSVTPQAVTQYLKGVRALSGKNFPVSEQARKMVREYAGKIALKKRAVAETELLDLAYEVLTLTGSALHEGGWGRG